MDVDASLEADAQLAEAGKPGMGALDHPAMPPQSIIALDPLASDAGGDAPLLEMVAAAVDIVGPVGVQLAWPASCTPGLACDRRQGIDQSLKDHRVVPVGSGHTERQGNAVAIDDQMPLAAELAAISRVRTRVGAPRGEATLAASRLARLRSSLSARRSSASRT